MSVCINVLYVSSEAFMLAFSRFEWITTQKYIFEHEKVRQFMVAESLSSQVIWLGYLYFTKIFCLLLSEKYFNHWMAAKVKNTMEFTGCHNHHRFKELNMRYLCSPSRCVCILCRVRIFYFPARSVCISACWKVFVCGIAITTYSDCHTTR